MGYGLIDLLLRLIAPHSISGGRVVCELAVKIEMVVVVSSGGVPT